MQTWEVLERAADKIERDGWNQGGYLGPGGGVCMAGGLRHALGYARIDGRWATFANELERDCAFAVATALGCDFPRGISKWNDRPGRTAAEVIAMLRAVAASEKARAARMLPVVR